MQYSLSDLQRLIKKRETAINRLLKRRKRLARTLASVDEQIARLDGGKVGRPYTPPAKNDVSLADLAKSILRKAGQPMRVADIAKQALKQGYKTNSKSFLQTVNAAVYKDPEIEHAGQRGFYRLKAKK